MTIVEEGYSTTDAHPKWHSSNKWLRRDTHSTQYYKKRRPVKKHGSSSSKRRSCVPVIDLFAGPGGLGEGFSALDRRRFRIALSIEKDPVAHRTLKLRSFFRQFPRARVPDEYYEVLRGELMAEVLFNLPKFKVQAKAAELEAWHAELGEVQATEVDQRIREALRGARTSVLIGGPPCQAYSVAGRSRNKGVKGYRPEKDNRHFLYKEYLRVLAVHSPAVFVMENVTGILSSKVGGEKIFARILADLRQPARAAGTRRKRSYGYRIYPLVDHEGDRSRSSTANDPDPHDYVVRCEHYGIPQTRHRVILVGVREDLKEVAPRTLEEARRRMSPTVEDVIGGMPALRSGLSRDDSAENWIAAIRKGTERHCLTAGVRRVAGDRVFGRIASVSRKINCPPHDRGAEFLRARTEFDNVTDPKLRRKLNDWYLDRWLGGLCNSTTRCHMASDLNRYLYASCFAAVHRRSPKLFELPGALKPDHQNADSDDFDDRFRVQLRGTPATTLMSHIAKDGHYYIHYDPSQCRSLTVREAARLQTFPDNYFFAGWRTQQYIQVGNAVPPLLALQIAAIVSDVLEQAGLV